MTQPVTQPLILLTKRYLNEFNRMLEGLPIDRYQYTLVLIEENGERLSQKALADLMQVDKSYMVTILDYLAEKGYVIREKNPQDRREQVIKLTEKAKHDVQLIKQAFDELNRRSLRNIQDDQLEVFNAVLRSMEDNLKQAETMSQTKPTTQY